MFYSESTGGFYATEIHGNNIPTDAVEIASEQHAALLEGQSEGKLITADENGFPVLIDPPPAPPYIPQQVTRAQGKMALIAAGIWDDVLDYVNGMESPVDKAMAEVALNDTNNWRRDSPFLTQAASEIGLTSEQLDDLFQQASLIDI